MRNNIRTKKLFSLVKDLPYFSIDKLKSLEANEAYLKIFLSRYCQQGKIVRLKKGLYIAKTAVDEMEKKNRLSSYLEFTANMLSFPSYLSLEYILYKHNILTEVPKNFTSISLKKTKTFTNCFNTFLYHKIKTNLYLGYQVLEKDSFYICEASKSKALFDFLYLRKNILVNKKSVLSLRLNIDQFNKKEINEILKFVKLEGSEKLKQIIKYLFKI